MFKICEDRSTNTHELRLVVVEALQKLIDNKKPIVALEADLGGASGFTKIQKSHPDNFIQCGIAEANMVGVSAGLSLLGYIPFMHTFGPFASRRVFDQVFLSGGYANTNLNIYGSDPGFCVGPNGGTHTTWEDVALMRCIPNAIVCDAADAVQLDWIINAFAELPHGVHYVRANRKPVRPIYQSGSTFTIGKGNILRKGTDILIITAGQLCSDALDCAEKMACDGYSIEVIDMFTIKPIDAALIVQEATDKRLIITFENHSIKGGLGSAVAEVLAQNAVGIPLIMHGVDERFGQVGSPDFLQKEFKLTAQALEDIIKSN